MSLFLDDLEAEIVRAAETGATVTVYTRDKHIRVDSTGGSDERDMVILGCAISCLLDHMMAASGDYTAKREEALEIWNRVWTAIEVEFLDRYPKKE